MNAAAHAGFDSFFDDNYLLVVDLLTEVFDSTPVALEEARSSFASAYRFWKKIGPHDDPLEWIVKDALARLRHRWADDDADTVNPTLAHATFVIRRHGFTDAQLRNIIGLAETGELDADPLASTRVPSETAAPGLVAEKRFVIGLARRRRLVATVVLGGVFLFLAAFETFIGRG
jgi:hypothetical protein